MSRRQEPNMPSGSRSYTAPHPSSISSTSSTYIPPSNQLPPYQLPQYITAEHSFNTSSTGSQESVMSQAPGQFHPNADGSYAVQGYNNGYVPTAAYGAISVPFATPVLSSDGTFQQEQTRGGLNPNSANFQPNLNGAVNNANNFIGSNSFNSSFGSNTSSGYDSAAGLIYPPASQIGSASPYSPYGGVPLAGASGGQYQNGVQFGNDYGVAASGYGSGTNSNFGSYNPHNGNQGYTPQAHASGYNNTGNSYCGNSFQGMGYGNGQNAISSSMGYQDRLSQYQDYHNKNNQYAVQQQQQQGSYYASANVNRGKPAHFGGSHGNNGFNQRNHRPSNLATAPVVNANPAQKYKQPQQGGPVRAPSAVQAPSPSKSRASERSQAGSGIAPDTVHATPNRGQETPTPHLRSRRGQAISTDPSKNATTANWVEGVTNGGGGPGESQNFRGSPPKMGGLGTSADVNADEMRSKGADPFTTISGSKRSFNNPFEPIPQQLTPYKSSGAVSKIVDGPSQELRLLTDNGSRKPTLVEALEMKNLPFAEYCRLGSEDVWGVIRIKNIPYSVNRPEILAFLGRNARIISDTEYEPVHIVMERVTSKTLDAYVEFVSFNEAVNAVNRFETNRTGGRGGRLGKRHVDVELSSQDQLMKDLFPKAKNVQWRGSQPVIIERDPNDPYNSGFQGFISKEELVMLVKHVEAPQRSPFSKECPQRPFECIISTLLKYPWYMVDHITIEDRNLLHQATIQLIFLLRTKLEENGADTHLTPMLLKRVWRAALKCPGFSPSQKDDIIVAAGLDIRESIEHAVPPFAAEWKYLFTIGPKPGVPYDVIYYYAALIREATEKKEYLSLAEKAAKGVEDKQPKLFGDLGAYIGLPTNNEEFIHMTLGQVAAKEWTGIEQALTFALAPQMT